MKAFWVALKHELKKTTVQFGILAVLTGGAGLVLGFLGLSAIAIPLLITCILSGLTVILWPIFIGG